jgi:hypothetical protein
LNQNVHTAPQTSSFCVITYILETSASLKRQLSESCDAGSQAIAPIHIDEHFPNQYVDHRQTS